MKVVYDWIKEYVGEECPSVEKFDELFTFHAFEIEGIEKIGNHDVIDVKVLPDRASDCLSHRGIARELSAIVGKPLVYDPFKKECLLTPTTEKIKVTIENSENCRRFAGALITGISVQESPDWLKERLIALGQRSINNIVDATNYVMFALGQPLHAYDAEKFEMSDGVWHFGVRMSKEGEAVTTLSGDTYTFNADVQLIVNDGTGAPVGIAGIKGGKSAEITESTTTIILESANFNPKITRKGAQSTHLETDASKRFENNLSPELVPYGLKECVDLILKIAGGTCEGYVDEYLTKKDNLAVAVQLPRINALLGLELNEQEVTDILIKRLGFTCAYGDSTWWALAPFERTDITIPADVIAEIGRIHGYEHIASVVPETVPLTEHNSRYHYTEKIKNILVEEGFSEVITSSFRKKDVVELENALASDKKYLRSTLRENVRETLDKNMPNIDLLGVPYEQVFEIGTVFSKTEDDTDVTEHISLSLGVSMKQGGSTPTDDARLVEVAKKLGAELGQSLDMKIDRGVMECNISTLLDTLKAPSEYESYGVSPDVQFTPYSPYPHITRDIALWVPETVSSIEIESLLREKAGTLLVRLSLFDEFKKDDRISYAFRLVFQSGERTLTDDEIGAIMEGIYSEMKEREFEVR